MQQLKKQQTGFTIIEVMIVLVIAAVILLIVFLAVPALQRNSRNTQRKNDVARSLAAAAEWRANNKNAWPTTCLGAGVSFVCGSTTDRDAVKTLAGTVISYAAADKFGIMNAPGGNTGDLSSGTHNLGNSARGDAVIIVGQASCTNSNTLATGSGFVAVYGIESGSTMTALCQAS